MVSIKLLSLSDSLLSIKLGRLFFNCSIFCKLFSSSYASMVLRSTSKSSNCFTPNRLSGDFLRFSNSLMSFLISNFLEYNFESSYLSGVSGSVFFRIVSLMKNLRLIVFLSLFFDLAIFSQSLKKSFIVILSGLTSNSLIMLLIVSNHELIRSFEVCSS